MALLPIVTLAAPAAANEGNSGNTQFRFVVTRSGLTSTACSCDWALSGTVTSDDLAAGQATSGTVNFAAGVTTQNIDINVVGDTTEETDETITITLSNPAGCVILKQPANGTIVSVADDYQVTYTPNSGFTGTETFNYTARNGTGSALTANISITVSSAPPPPTSYSHVANLTLPSWGTGLSSMSNFLLPLSISHPDLRTVANGGKVQHASGYDIRFETTTGTKLAHKDIYYDGVNGVVVKLVNMPRNFSAAETIKVFIGKSGLSVSEEDVTNARAGGWLAWYAGSGTDRTGNSRTLNAVGTPPASSIYLWPGANLNGSSQYFQSPSTIAWLNSLTSLSVVSYHRAVGTTPKYELFNVSNGTATELALHMNDSATNRLTFSIKYGTTVHAYQSANDTQSIDGQGIAVAAQAGQAIRMAINGALDTATAAATPAAGSTTSISDNLEWGRGNRSDLINWDGDLGFLGFCDQALPTPALESMSAAFFNPSRVYTLGSFAAVP